MSVAERYTQEELKLELQESSSFKKLTFRSIDESSNISELSTPKSIAAVQFSTHTKLTVHDRKIYNVLLRYALPTLRESNVFSIPISLVASWIGFPNRLEIIYPAIERIRNSNVKFNILGEDEVSENIERMGYSMMSTGLLGSCALSKDKKYVEFSFDYHMKMVLSYPKRYASINFAASNKFSSIYHLSLYENLLAFFIPNRPISLSRMFTKDEIASLMCVPLDEDKKVKERSLSYLKSKLIASAVKAINDNKDVEFEIDRIQDEKIGKQIYRIGFVLIPRKSTNEKTSLSKTGQSSFIESEKIKETNSYLESIGFKESERGTFVEEKDFSVIYETIKAIKFGENRYPNEKRVTKEQFLSFISDNRLIPGYKLFVQELVKSNSIAREDIVKFFLQKKKESKKNIGYSQTIHLSKELISSAQNPTKARELEILFIDSENGAQVFGDCVSQLYKTALSVNFMKEAELLYYFWVYENYESCSKFIKGEKD